MNRYLLSLGILILSAGLAHASSGDGDRFHEKVEVCHKDHHEINVDEHAVDAHLRHGDCLGECPCSVGGEGEGEDDSDSDSDSDSDNGGEGEGEGDCVISQDCDDGLFCNGSEVCLDGFCYGGSDPCVDNECSEDLAACNTSRDCVTDEDCDDNLFCSGHEVCSFGTCFNGISLCINGEICDETVDACTDASVGPVGGGSDPEDQLFVSGSSILSCSSTPDGGMGLLAVLAPLVLLLARRRGLALIAVLILSLSANAEGLNRVVGPTTQFDTLYTQSPELLNHLETNVLFGFDYSHDPVVFRDQFFDKKVSAVEHQFTGRVSASLGLLDNLQLDASLPVSFAFGQGVQLDGVPAVGLQDALLGARLRLNDVGSPYGAALTLSSTVPSALLSSNGNPVLGEDYPTVTPSILLSASDGHVVATTNVGFLARVPRQVADLTVGHMVLASASIQARFLHGEDFEAWWRAEVGGGISNQFLQSSRDMMPVEASVGLYGVKGPVFGTVSAGLGHIPDVGIPDVRVAGSVGFDFDFAPNVVPRSEVPDEPVEVGPVDSDGDGLLDDVDRCPESPEDFDGVEDEDGCPEEYPAIIDENNVLHTMDPVYFFFDSDRIRPESFETLDYVANVLKDNPNLLLVFINGHTSSEGTLEYNYRLATRRTEAVKEYLVGAGVSDVRLMPISYGEVAPVASNLTKAGREQNRRVEFKVYSK